MMIVAWNKADVHPNASRPLIGLSARRDRDPIRGRIARQRLEFIFHGALDTVRESEPVNTKLKRASVVSYGLGCLLRGASRSAPLCATHF